MLERNWAGATVQAQLCRRSRNSVHHTPPAPISAIRNRCNRGRHIQQPRPSPRYSASVRLRYGIIVFIRFTPVAP